MGPNIRAWLYFVLSTGVMFMSANLTHERGMEEWERCNDRIHAQTKPLMQLRDQNKITMKEYEIRLENIYRKANPASPLYPCPMPDSGSALGNTIKIVILWAFLVGADVAVQSLLWRHRRK